MKKENILKLAAKYLDNNILLPIGFSSCLIGTKCGWEGDDYSVDLVESIFNSQKVLRVHFCPENFSFGTPREFSSIHGGTGEDVLDGKARVFTVTGKDWTEGALRAAHETLKVFKEKGAVMAIMTDTSPSCGSHVIYSGNPSDKNYLQGFGVTAALLQRNGIEIIAQRDTKTLSYLLQILDNKFEPDKNAIDYVESEWYTTYFKAK